MADFNLKYKKHNPVHSSQELPITGITFDSEDQYPTESPSWVWASADTVNSKMKASVYDGGTSNMDPGTYTGTIKLFHRWIHPGHGDVRLDLIREYSIELELQEYIYTSISPLSFEFHHQIGTQLPPDQILQITSEETYTLVASEGWIKLDTATATGNRNIPIGVHVQGLTPGPYNGTIEIQSPQRSFSIPISLTIEGEIETDDFLFVTPETLKFTFNRYGFLPSPKNVSVNASKAFTIEETTPWFSTSISLGDQNTLSFDVAITDAINQLGVGEYTSEITLRMGEILKKVQVIVTISHFLEEIFKSDNLYFTDDPNVIRLASSDVNTHLSVLIEAKHEKKINNFTYSVPFFKGESKTYIVPEGKLRFFIFYRQLFLI